MVTCGIKQAKLKTHTQKFVFEFLYGSCYQYQLIRSTIQSEKVWGPGGPGGPRDPGGPGEDQKSLTYYYFMPLLS